MHGWPAPAQGGHQLPCAGKGHQTAQQRVAEEQLRRELTEWRADHEKRWAQESERQERLGQEQARLESQQDARLTAVEGAHEEQVQRLATLVTALEALRLQTVSENHETRLIAQRAWEQLGQALQQVVGNLRELWEKE